MLPIIIAASFYAVSTNSFSKRNHSCRFCAAFFHSCSTGASINYSANINIDVNNSANAKSNVAGNVFGVQHLSVDHHKYF